MTKVKGLKTVSSTAAARVGTGATTGRISSNTGRISSTTGSIVGATAQNIPKTKSSSVKARAANQRADDVQSRVFGVQVPADIDMDELARKIAANMQQTPMPPLTAPQDTAFQTNLQSMSQLRCCDPEIKVSPIDGAFNDLAGALYDLETQAQALIQSIEPILTFDSNELKCGGDPQPVPYSPMHSRLLELTSRVRALTEQVAVARGRVQL
jgi:hypothetical protein